MDVGANLRHSQVPLRDSATAVRGSLGVRRLASTRYSYPRPPPEIAEPKVKPTFAAVLCQRMPYRINFSCTETRLIVSSDRETSMSFLR